MSEFINNTEKSGKLYEYAHRLINGENGRMLIEEYKPYIETVTAADTMQVLDKLLQHGHTFEEVKANVGKIINIFFKSLSAFQWEKPDDGHFIHYLMLENREVEKIMTEIKTINKPLLKENIQNEKELILQLTLLLKKLKDYELHYIKKENILFPYIENTFPQFRCLQLMWSFHDDFRKSLKTLENILGTEKPEKNQLNIELGKLFFVVLPIIFREEQIVFPVALRAIPQKAWDEMLEQSFETGWCYDINPKLQKTISNQDNSINGLINLDTGSLSAQQLILLFENLPVDITFVDDNDEVLYFSGAKHRIFPRSKAIIGRKVQNCHPPESVHIVNEIVDAFKTGKKDHADFWIQMKEKFIHIRYFALRDAIGVYKGTIEVSQDVTEIRALKGEQRLLDWTE
jgi:DUF438 domain-containing protein